MTALPQHVEVADADGREPRPSATDPVDGLATLVWGRDGSPAHVRRWSAPGEADGDVPGAVVADTLVLPARGTPRLLLPAMRPAAIVRFLTDYWRLRERPVAVQRGFLAMAVRARVPLVSARAQVVHPTAATSDRGRAGEVAGARAETIRGATFADLLEDAVDADVGCAVIVRHVDDHYKPTIQLVDQNGRVRAFAKVGWTPATAPMVRREIAASARAAAEAGRLAARLRAPALLAHGEHDGHPYMVTEALSPRLRRPRAADPLPEVALAVSRPWEGPRLRDSAYFADLSARASHADDRVQAALAALAGSERAWMLGAWHGDWVPWNVGLERGAVWAWDWEHSADEVPFGFDVLHWLTTTPVVMRGRGIGEALRASVRTLTSRPDMLSGLVIGHVALTELALAYLVELAVRAAGLHARGTGPVLFPGIDDALADAVLAVRTARDVAAGTPVG